MSALSKNRAKIGLERLETRDQMSVVVSGAGLPIPTLLFSEASWTPNAGDRIEIVDTGLGGGGQLHYRVNHGAWFAVRGTVWRVALDLRGGNDTVIYNLGKSFDPAADGGLGAATNELAGRYREIRGGVASIGALAPTDGTGLGGGDDQLRVTVWGDVGSRTPGPDSGFGLYVEAGDGDDDVTTQLYGGVFGRALVGVEVNGGGGRDSVGLSLPDDADVGSNAVVRSVLNGGAGDDGVYLGFRGELDGRLLSVLDGGDGNDWVGSNVTLDFGSTGYLGDVSRPARLSGGAGDDTLIDLVTNNSGAPYYVPSITADLFGGGGEDTFIYTPLWVSVPDMTASESGRATRR